MPEMLLIRIQNNITKYRNHVPNKLSVFQMFGFVVLFGLLHALFFLPICLSIMGPLQTDDGDETGAGIANKDIR